MAEEVEIVLKGEFKNGKLLVDTTDKLDKNVKKIGTDAEKTDKNVNKLTSGLKKLAAIVGIGLVVRGFNNLVKSSLRAAGAMEQVDVALTTMLGSAEKAAKLQKDLIEFAKATPFEIEGIFQTTKQLLAYGVAQEDIIKTMGTLGNIAAGVGVDMNRLALVFGQVRSTGKLLGQDLNQFTQAGVPLLAELAKLLGTTEAEVIKLKESGQISFDLVRQALENMTSEGGRFFNLMENQSKTLLGTISNMQDGFFQVKNALGQALLPAAKRVINFMIPSLNRLTKLIERNSKAIDKFAQGFINFFSRLKRGFSPIFSLMGDFRQSIEDITITFFIMALNVEKIFDQMKLVIFDFVENVLDKLGLISNLPMFGWIDDAKQDFTSMKTSIIKDIKDIEREISNIRAVQAESRLTPLAKSEAIEPVAETAAAQKQTTAIIAADPEKVEKARLKALKEENALLLEEQKNFLMGFATNETEAESLMADNKLMRRQRDILEQKEFAERKKALDEQLLNDKITLDEFENELDQINNDARIVALEEQLNKELELEQQNSQKILETKVKLEKAKAKEETKADKMRNFFQKKEIKNAERGAAALVQLQNSKSKELAAIGKAAAIFQITMNTARGALDAYSAMAPIPIVGPALGAAAAAAVIAYGAEQLGTVKSNSFAVGTPEIPSDQLAQVHKGEMIVPATFSDAIRSGELSLSGGGAENETAGSTNININFEGAQFVGEFSDDDITTIGERLGELISEDIIPAIPTREA